MRGTRYTHRKNYLANFSLEDFDPSKTYTPAQLEAYSDLMIDQDRRNRPDKEGYPKVLMQEHVETQWQREVNSGTEIDPAITVEGSPDGQRMYNRTHPEGRKVNSPEQRKKNGASWYR